MHAPVIARHRIRSNDALNELLHRVERLRDSRDEPPPWRRRRCAPLLLLAYVEGCPQSRVANGLHAGFETPRLLGTLPKHRTECDADTASIRRRMTQLCSAAAVAPGAAGFGA
jgi:hypothetical protein